MGEIDNLGDDFLEKYWDYDKNKLNPWKITKCADNKIFIICQTKDYHESYKISCNDFYRGNRCSYCSNKSGKVHPLDSLGTLYPEVLDIWSNKNEKSPYKYTPNSGKKVYWKCPDGIHEDFPRRIEESKRAMFRCPECQHSLGENMIAQYLVFKNIIYIFQHKFLNCKYKHVLKFDFYLTDYNTCIEYQGIHHYEPVDFAGRGKEWAEQQFEKQKIKDQIKRDYCKMNNIKLIEIPYWDFDNIEQILSKELDL